MSGPLRTRRELVVAGGALAAGLALTTPAHARLLPATRGVGRGRFLDGVASGEPGPNAVTFWGRLSTARPRSAARLVVASDPGLRNTVATAVVPTSSAVDHTLKTRIGGLLPARHYWYAWQSADDVSPIGRTKTAPPADSRTPVAVGFSSCQKLPTGFFNAHHDALTHELDVYAFLGDYTYEYDAARNDVSTRLDRGPGYVDPPSTDLTSYRAKLRLYRADPGLRELHRLHPIVHTWDDHEVENDYTDGDPAPSAGQRNAGYRASFEWLPRIAFPGDRFRVHRSLRYGANLELFMLDERQYRTPGGGTILGRRQMDWIKQGLERTPARWKLVGNPDMLAPLGVVLGGEGGITINPDQWDGYPADRAELLAHLADRRIDDVAFLTGDIHIYMANHLLHGGRPVATEYIGGSVTSTGIPASLNGLAVPAIQLVNPHIRFIEGAEHGWAIARVDPDELRVEYRVSDIRRDRAPSRTLASFVQRRGTNRLEQAAGVAGGGATARRLGEDPADAPAAAGSPLAERRAAVRRAAGRDLQRRTAAAERRASPAARRAIRQDQSKRTRTR
ncbi:alkaline phosphatase D family protein [Patulibacter defluvii]|uniref:alkaline phosphatase D family protein n=1 Tax=Patulibacter defluvii TaxID=3095358 RepID=UPI002A76630C|nr:alkaline phosphatase D family protein [Patulibacter sp. DM4]